jgi:dipeptidyl-peptidase-4
VWVALPGDARDFYVARVDWVDATGELLIQRLDRRQKEIELFLVDPASGAARSVLKDRDEAWIDVVDDRRWLFGGRELLWTSERDGWRHLWRVSFADGRWRNLTPGDYDVTGFVGVDEEHGIVYFQASPEEPSRRYLYAVSLRGGDAERLTPDEPGTHTYELAPSATLAFHTVSTFDAPPRTELVRLPSHERVRVLEDNAELAQRMQAFAAEPVDFTRVEVEPGVELQAWMIPPAGFDPSRRYPVVQFVYGEPSAVQVTDAWKTNRLLFNRALAQAGYAVVCVDSRGSPTPFGRAWRKSTAGMPAKGADDQAAGLRALLAARPYLDPERVGVWGWSGGGTMTLNLMFRYPDLYRVGMAVAPVPDLTLYDSIYQERYTGLPQENPEGYRTGSPITYADGLRGDPPARARHG